MSWVLLKSSGLYNRVIIERFEDLAGFSPTWRGNLDSFCKNHKSRPFDTALTPLISWVMALF